MTEDSELIRGSGNVFRDFGRPDSDLEQIRTILAATIIRVLDEEHLTVRAAEERTGVSASEFSRIRNLRLERFTIDRLVSILGKLSRKVEIQVKVTPQGVAGSRAA
jgi:predicted XRE-type DNA-binding protein